MGWSKNCNFRENFEWPGFAAGSKPADNIGLPQWRVTCFYDTFVLTRSAMLPMNFSAKNPLLQQDVNR